jgi:Holliday junction resolvase RusA-like endonuclease
MIPVEERKEVLRGLVAAANRIAGTGIDDDTWDIGPVFVKGTPAPQGSKKWLGVTTPKDGSRGKPRFEESSKGLKGWRSEIRRVVTPLMEGRELLDGPLEVRVRFVFQRPQHHHVAGDRSRPLKANAPVYHAQAPDLSKLLRGMEDDLNKLVWTDDSRIARFVDPVKVWGSQPGMELSIRRIRA